MPTTIISNGSRFAGQANATLPELLAVMAAHPIAAHFRDILVGNVPGRLGFVCYLGNFEDISHVFHIVTDEPEVCATMNAAIRANAGRFGWSLDAALPAIDPDTIAAAHPYTAPTTQPHVWDAAREVLIDAGLLS